jgi:transcription antitermination factor NusA-like protein|tara:strand:- start:539 stop:844 length:306 start_codon:yes stop_codon:yes gene_type:complete
MEKRKNLNSQQFVEEAIDNVRKDRAMASTLLVELVKILKTDETKHQYSGPVAAKYLETLQRSNEQLVKLASLLSKKESTVTDLSQLEKSEIYDLINEEEEG